MKQIFFDTRYSWHDNIDHLTDIDQKIHEIYPQLIADHCPCDSCTRSAESRLDKLKNDKSFCPAMNDDNAMFLLKYINFACWRIDNNYDFYEISIYDYRGIIPAHKMIFRSYPKLSEAICVALIALYQKEWQDYRKW